MDERFEIHLSSARSLTRLGYPALCMRKEIVYVAVSHRHIDVKLVVFFEGVEDCTLDAVNRPLKPGTSSAPPSSGSTPNSAK